MHKTLPGTSSWRKGAGPKVVSGGQKMLELPANGRGGLLFQLHGVHRSPRGAVAEQGLGGRLGFVSPERQGSEPLTERAACAKATWPSIGHMAHAGYEKDHRTSPGMAAPPSWPLPVLEGLGLAYPGITHEPEWPVQTEVAWPGASTTCCPLAKGQGVILLERAGLLCCPCKTSKC